MNFRLLFSVSVFLFLVFGLPFSLILFLCLHASISFFRFLYLFCVSPFLISVFFPCWFSFFLRSASVLSSFCVVSVSSFLSFFCFAFRLGGAGGWGGVGELSRKINVKTKLKDITK